MEREEILKDYICAKYKSVRQFCIENDLKYSTVVAMLSRGLNNSNTDTVFKVCKALNIYVEPLITNGEFISLPSDADKKKTYNLENYFKVINYAAFGGMVKLDGIFLNDREIHSLEDYTDLILELIRKKRKETNLK